MLIKLEKIISKKIIGPKIKKIITNKDILGCWAEAVDSVNKKAKNKTKAVRFENKILKVNCDNFSVISELQLKKNDLIKWFLKEKKQEIKNIIFKN